MKEIITMAITMSMFVDKETAHSFSLSEQKSTATFCVTPKTIRYIKQDEGQKVIIKRLSGDHVMYDVYEQRRKKRTMKIDRDLSMERFELICLFFSN